MINYGRRNTRCINFDKSLVLRNQSWRKNTSKFYFRNSTKAETIEIPILYTHTQHKRLRELDKDKEYFWFFELPESTAQTKGKPLVRYFTGKIRITLDTITPEEFIKDKMSLYKTSAIEENEGFPTA